jgi:predicted nucleotide-binding protein
MSTTEEKIKLIQSLIIQFRELPHRDEGRLDALRRRARMIITKVCGDSSTYLEDVNKIRFYPMVAPTTEAFKDERWASGQREMINLLTTIEEDLTISNSECVPSTNGKKKEYSNKVFIVHGHDELPKERLARILIELGLKPIILHDQPNRGRTLMEKFEQEANDVGYAFVIMTPDDLGIDAKLHEEIKKGGLCYRPRQNVVLELGFFFAKLGRGRVCCLVKGDVEKPSDINGIIYLHFNNKVNEVYQEIVRELKDLGYKLKT